MDDQLIDKMADAIVISMVKQGAAAPASWASAFNYVRQRNPFTPEMVQKTKDWALKGGKMGTGVGAGIGAAAGMIRGARQTAQQAGGWRNASFGQYAKNMAGQGAMGGAIGAGVGAVGGAGAGAIGATAPYMGQIAKQTVGVHKKDQQAMNIINRMRDVRTQADQQYQKVKGQMDVQKQRMATNQQGYADANKNQNFFGKLFGVGQNARIKEKTKANAEDAFRQINQMGSQAYSDAKGHYNNLNNIQNEMGNWLSTVGSLSNNLEQHTSLPLRYINDSVNQAREYSEQGIRNLGNLVSY